jgi:polysaccharide pyruvyl transferase WcaK-like protein
MMKTPLCLLPQTYGPFKHPVSKQIASWIMSHATAIMSRDEESIELVKFLTSGRSKKPLILFCPDVAFTLAPMAVDYPKIDPSLPDTQDMTLIGFNINGLMYNGGYTQDNMFGLKIDYRQFARRLTLSLLEKTTSHILLVPHTFGSPGNINSDPDACRNILEQLPINYQGRVHMVTEQYDQAELKFIIGKCDLFIGSRMHSCIAALSQSIPTFGIAYSKKFLGVFRSIGAGDWVLDGRTLDADAITGSLVDAAQNISNLKFHFKVDLASVQNKINDRFREILG